MKIVKLISSGKLLKIEEGNYECFDSSYPIPKDVSKELKKYWIKITAELEDGKEIPSGWQELDILSTDKMVGENI